MKFDLEKFKAGMPAKTRNGQRVEFLYFSEKLRAGFQLGGMNESSEMRTFDRQGRSYSFDLNLDLVELWEEAGKEAVYIDTEDRYSIFYNPDKISTLPQGYRLLMTHENPREGDELHISGNDTWMDTQNYGSGVGKAKATYRTKRPLLPPLEKAVDPYQKFRDAVAAGETVQILTGIGNFGTWKDGCDLTFSASPDKYRIKPKEAKAPSVMMGSVSTECTSIFTYGIKLGTTIRFKYADNVSMILGKNSSDAYQFFDDSGEIQWMDLEGLREAKTEYYCELNKKWLPC